MKAILVGIWNKDTSRESARESIKELEDLLEAVGGESLGYVLQNRSRPDAKYYVGAGRAEELREISQGTGADTIVFDDPLTPSQIRNLEKLTGKTVLDRTDLVIEIFSRRARSREAKLQVELARLVHELPRLYGRGKALSRLGGGVGTRGPGEQEAELRRRSIRHRIYRIRRELEEIKRMRRHQRSRRMEEGVMRVAIVGYTNAGKSTLLKALTGRETFTADMPFATLDTKTSARPLSSGLRVLFTDTVGFIRKLPPELIESFKATLEEVTTADVLLHVVDISDDRWLDLIHTVKDILEELSAADKPVIYVLNKVDRIVSSEEEIEHLPHLAFVEGRGVIVSARRKWGLENLFEELRKLAEGNVLGASVGEART